MDLQRLRAHQLNRPGDDGARYDYDDSRERYGHDAQPGARGRAGASRPKKIPLVIEDELVAKSTGTAFARHRKTWRPLRTLRSSSVTITSGASRPNFPKWTRNSMGWMPGRKH